MITFMHNLRTLVISCLGGRLEIGVVLASVEPSDVTCKADRTSSGSGALAAALSSFSYWAMSAGSTWTSGGARAGAATNSSDWLLL